MAFKQTFRVRWVDTDTAGVMHYNNFLRYFEACEEEFYRSLGLTLSTIKAKYNVMLPRIEVHCQFSAACRLDDLIEVTLKVRELTEKAITYDFQLTRKADEKIAAEGYLKCIAVDQTWKAVPLPSELAQAIRENTV